ncbi:hypothetical protein STRDD11_01535 [Streptococcus sp. DD11]|uniref:hypothetical protein n=1 Tax=Streptococcus sp. DD11 TaxID=1777879 RepID=UPI00079C1417|nr:hypothetical protein [Streptococcus sp. DD11]KXT83338.1 hypothetical protein STRDD11_01535 [Streptococcus sp. DD11]
MEVPAVSKVPLELVSALLAFFFCNLKISGPGVASQPWIFQEQAADGGGIFIDKRTFFEYYFILA